MQKRGWVEEKGLIDMRARCQGVHALVPVVSWVPLLDGSGLVAMTSTESILASCLHYRRAVDETKRMGLCNIGWEWKLLQRITCIAKVLRNWYEASSIGIVMVRLAKRLMTI